MAEPAAHDIVTDRNVDWSDTWPFLREDFTGSTFKIHVRGTKDTTGTPLMDASSTYPGAGAFQLAVSTDTVANHISAGNLTSDIYSMINPATGTLYVSSTSVLVSRVRLGILKFYLQAFPYAAERGDDFVGYYDIVRTNASALTEVVMRGTFTVRAGSTI